MSDLAERMIEHIENSDHARGCMGRQYVCTCEYDTHTEMLLREGAAEIKKFQGIDAKLNHIIEQLNTVSRLATP